MKNLWAETEAEQFKSNPLQLRVYTSQLLGREPGLVLHGGGNTSVKISETNRFGEEEEILYVKGSGWDLETIKEEGFAPVKLDVLNRMARFEQLSDSEMVQLQRAAMTNPSAPNPSVEAILHAIIPFKYIDHTHADAVVTITNTSNGSERIENIYGKTMLVIPYVMPGFILAKEIFQTTKDIDWSAIDGMILMNHGVFTFHDDAKTSYDRMIDIVSRAESYIEQQGAGFMPEQAQGEKDMMALSKLRKIISAHTGKPVYGIFDNNPLATSFSNIGQIDSVATQGPLTPDHIIRTKQFPVVLHNDHEKEISSFCENYNSYFQRNTNGGLTCLNPAPKWAVWPGHGTVSFGHKLKEANTIRDISQHTTKAILEAEKLGGWQALPEQDLFEMEYWELEQAKLKKTGNELAFQGKVALITGAASGIGKACVKHFASNGAAVMAIDINPAIKDELHLPEIVCRECDIRKILSVTKAIEETVRMFGGIDILISNAGAFMATGPIEEMDAKDWNNSMELNLTSHQQLLQVCIPYLRNGIDPTAIFIGSKNVPAPGRNAAAYSVAKAGLTQLARVAALELGKYNIRVNVVHPNAVFDTDAWSDETLKERAGSYKLSVEEYKANNVLGTEITSEDVACLVGAMAGKAFMKTTGAQVPVDGGNERVI